MAAPLILAEAQPRRAADGGTEIIRLAGGGGARPYHYAGVHWRAGIAGLPTFICSLDFTGTDLGTGGVPQAAELEWGASRAADLASIANRVWADAPIVLRIGPEGALPPIRLAGKVLTSTVEGSKLKLSLADPAADLKKPLLTQRYGGTGDLEGPADWAGKIRRRIWGRLWNVQGEPIDPAYNIYAFADPYRPLQGFSAVRDKGAPAAAVSIVEWQGNPFATLAALRAAVAPQGGGVLAPSIACVKWWTQPAGDLCADIRGEIGAGYLETTAGIAERLVQGVGGPAFAAGTIAAAVAARPAPVGWLAANESTTVSEMLDQLLGNSSLLWLIDELGQIVVRAWEWSASAASAVSSEVKRTKSFRPLATRRLGYKRNELPMARGDIAAIVLTGDVQYPDGTPLEEAIDSIYDAIGDALTAAGNAQATADGKIATFYQDEPPGDADEGDLWFDTNDGYKQHRLSAAGDWEPVQDTAVGLAISAAAGAQATADGKVTTFVGPTPPLAEAIGDLWVNTSQGNKLYRWNNGWFAVQDVGAEAGQNGLEPDGTVKDGKVGTGALVAGSVTVPGSATSPDTTILAGSTVDVLTTGWINVGDSVDGGGLALAFGEVDSGTTKDVGARINLFVDINDGAGFVLGGTCGAGARTTGGDTYMKASVLASATFAGVSQVRLLLQVQSVKMPGGDFQSFTFRSPQIVILGGKR